MHSMTGFGRGTAAKHGWEIAVHISSVNRKTLEVGVSLPRELQALEPEINGLVRSRMARGRVQVNVEVRGPGSAGLDWDESAVEAALDRLDALAQKRGLPFVVTPELLFQVAHASRSEIVTLDPAIALELVQSALRPALDAFVAMRASEGGAMARDIAQRVNTLGVAVESIAQRTAATVQSYRETLLARLRQAGLELDLSDERVLKEIALFAERIDISEELTRLRSHLEQFSHLTSAAEPVGRKAEFLLQEIGRETHTIGSKANDLEIARAVIDFKNELERIREQIQNIE